MDICGLQSRCICSRISQTLQIVTRIPPESGEQDGCVSMLCVWVGIFDIAPQQSQKISYPFHEKLSGAT